MRTGVYATILPSTHTRRTVVRADPIVLYTSPHQISTTRANKLSNSSDITHLNSQKHFENKIKVPKSTTLANLGDK